MATNQEKLDAIYDAIFNGGPSMKYGASLQNLIDDIPRRVVTWPVQRNGKNVSMIQDNADAGSNILALISKVNTLSTAAPAPAPVAAAVAALSAQDLADLAKAVNDEADARARQRLAQ